MFPGPKNHMTRMWKGDANLCHGFVPTFRGIPCYPDVSRNSNELASWKREGLRSSTLNWPRDVAIGELQELQEVQEVQEVKEVKENGNLHEELTKPVTFKTPRHFGSTGKSYSAAAWLFVSDHTDAIGCSRLLQSDTGSREKRKDVPTMAKQSKRSWTLLFLLFLFYVNLFFLVGPASFFAIPQEFDICN